MYRNIIATVDLKRKFPLHDIIARIDGAHSFSFEGENTVRLRIQKPKATVVVFSTGKALVVGPQSGKEFKRAVKKFMRKISSEFGVVNDFDQRIRNVCATVDVHFQIDLEDFADTHSRYIKYEPGSSFLVYFLIDPLVSFIVFKDGNVQIQGAKNREEVESTFELFYPTLLDFKYPRPQLP